MVTTTCSVCNRAVHDTDVNDNGECILCEENPQESPVVPSTATEDTKVTPGPEVPAEALTEAPSDTGSSVPGEGSEIPARDDHNTGSQKALDPVHTEDWHPLDD
jgi:hypothetical protein